MRHQLSGNIFCDSTARERRWDHRSRWCRSFRDMSNDAVRARSVKISPKPHFSAYLGIKSACSPRGICIRSYYSNSTIDQRRSAGSPHLSHHLISNRLRHRHRILERLPLRQPVSEQGQVGVQRAPGQVLIPQRHITRCSADGNVAQVEGFAHRPPFLPKH